MNVLIGAGHRHTLGEQGNPFERDMNGKKCRAILDTYDANGGKANYGFDLRCYTPDRGLGLYPGYLNQAPVSGFQDRSWPVDLMVELHSEGVGNTGVRGAFVIYPDWGNDVDVDVRTYGHLFATAMTEIGMGVRGNGTMSEKNTGVGLQGYRLGVFRDTAIYAARTTRMIFEQGAHSNPAERAIMESPNFLTFQANAFLDSVQEFFDRIEPEWDANRPDPVTYVDPAAVPWKIGFDLGWQNLNGVDAYSFTAQGTTRKRTIKRAWASDDAPVSGEAYPAGTAITLCGFFRTPDRIRWYLDGQGNRLRASSIATDFRVIEE